jgi:integrase
MRKEIDVHHSHRRYEHAIQALKLDRKVIEANRKLILAFTRDLQAENITELRISKYINLLRHLSALLEKTFEEATVTDLRSVVADINGSEYSAWSKNDYKVTLKKFYKWLRKLPNDQEPAETSWIKTGHPKNGILPEELLTEEDIGKLTKAAENSRDRAFVECVYETGGRIGELLNLRRKHVQFDDIGAVLIFSGKTGDRRVRLITTAPALSQWMLDHPLDDPEAPLWVTLGDRNRGAPLDYGAARYALQSLAEKAKIKKRTNPHSFRHARASYLANHLTEQQLGQYLGWTPGSRMPGVYVHLSGRDTDSALLKMYGIENEENKKEQAKLTPLKCSRCQQMNDPTVRFCAKCGMPLKIDAALEVEQQRSQADDIMNRLFDDPEFRTYITSKLKSLGLNQTTNKKVGFIQP